MNEHCLAGGENLHHLREDRVQCLATPRLVSHGQEGDLLLAVFNGVTPWLDHASEPVVPYTGRHHEEADVVLGDEIVVLDLMGWFAQ